MQPQLFLNYALQSVVWVFVFLMILDFVGGLLERARLARVASLITILPAKAEPQPVFEAIADPWVLDADIDIAPPQAIAQVKAELSLPPAEELPLIVQVEQQVKAIAWQQLRKIISDYKLSVKGKRSQLERRFLDYCQSRNEEQLRTVLEYLRV